MARARSHFLLLSAQYWSGDRGWPVLCAESLESHGVPGLGPVVNLLPGSHYSDVQQHLQVDFRVRLHLVLFWEAQSRELH